MSPGFGLLADGFDAVVQAYAEPAAAIDVDPPKAATLVSLPGILAAAEAVAIAGSQDLAGLWLAWFDRELPIAVLTSMEWPSCASRLRGLLCIRVGLESRAVRYLREAARWAQRSGYRVEQGIALVQLAELLALGGKRYPERDWTTAQRIGRLILSELGVDSQMHAYAADRVMALGRSAAAEPRLTGREVQVLRLLAEGLTYKEAAARLGIEWHTVQVHAKNIYRKLGASRRIEAIANARKLRVI